VADLDHKGQETMRRNTKRSTEKVMVSVFFVTFRAAMFTLFMFMILPLPAFADGTPVHVVLNYLNGVSNWGPTDAGGVLELVRAEGEARLTVRGLPKTPGQHDVLWLIHEGTNEVFRLGELQFQADGTATLDLFLPDPIPDQGWNLAMVTVENTAAPEHPGPRHAVAGRFPQPPREGILPGALPNTGLGGGMSAERSDVMTAGLMLGLLGLVRFSLRTRRPKS